MNKKSETCIYYMHIREPSRPELVYICGTFARVPKVETVMIYSHSFFFFFFFWWGISYIINITIHKFIFYVWITWTWRYVNFRGKKYIERAYHITKNDFYTLGIWLFPNSYDTYLGSFLYKGEVRCLPNSLPILGHSWLFPWTWARSVLICSCPPT